jgi:predicted RNase H-like nuclease (RuvC/YqgF family)
MRWPFISRSRHDDEVAALRRRVLATEARHDDVVRAHNALARQLAEADAANRRLADRNLELGRRVSALAEADPEYAAELEQKVARLTEGYAAEKKRADHLQRRLDDAVGLSAGRIADSRQWQPGYQKPEVAS